MRFLLSHGPLAQKRAAASLLAGGLLDALCDIQQRPTWPYLDARYAAFALVFVHTGCCVAVIAHHELQSACMHMLVLPLQPQQPRRARMAIAMARLNFDVFGGLHTTSDGQTRSCSAVPKSKRGGFAFRTRFVQSPDPKFGHNSRPRTCIAAIQCCCSHAGVVMSTVSCANRR